MTPDHVADALYLLDSAEETHSGAPADTSIARAQVHATLAVAEQLAQLTKLLAAQHGPLVDTSEEGCVDHLPVARTGCRECARAQGIAR
ncbi:hypothetical protein GCM10017673_37730 [Streptosporangium violaceochromogenes]|nr:hypothetical protein GCM10017673_37730 [Streptosporangium violaceochromogenes]